MDSKENECDEPSGDVANIDYHKFNYEFIDQNVIDKLIRKGEEAQVKSNEA